MKYWSLALDAWVVLPKWLAAFSASVANCAGEATSGAAAVVSSHAPANAPPVGYPACSTLFGHETVPTATPWQYWVATPLHVSELVPSPLKKASRSGAIPLGSPE